MLAIQVIESVFLWIARTSAEAAIIVVIILGVQVLLRNRLRPRWRYALWLVLVARLLIPWAPESSVSIFNLVAKVRAYAVARETAPVPYARIFQADTAGSPLLFSEPVPTAPLASTPPRPSLAPKGLMALLWLLGASAFAAHVAFENTRFWRKVRQDRVIEDAATIDLLAQCRTRLSVQTPVRLVASQAVTSPALFGFLHPWLLLPSVMADEGNLDRLRYVFVHELAHLKRHDVLVNWLTTLIQAAHWFNPFLWYAFYRMRIDREPACDALALSCLEPAESQQYGQTILDLLESTYTVRRVPGMAGILEDKSQLKRRITQIALFTRNSYRWSLVACLALALVASLGLTNARSSPSEQPQDSSFGSKRTSTNEKGSAGKDAGGNIVVNFPDHKSMGALMTREVAAEEDLQDGWKEFGTARGAIQIPSGKTLGLFMNENASHDLSGLDALKADDLFLLSITSPNVKDEDLVHIAHLTGLRVLILQGTTIDGSGFIHLAKLANLRELRLGDHNGRIADENIRPLGQLTSLTWLALWGTQIGDAGMGYLAPLTSLRSLMLGDCPITDSGLAVLHDFPELETLQIDGTTVTDGSLATIDSLTKLKNLKIGKSAITNDGLSHLERLTKMENLWIDGTAITDEGLAHIAGLPNLWYLNAEGTKITDAGVMNLNELAANGATSKDTLPPWHCVFEQNYRRGNGPPDRARNAAIGLPAVSSAPPEDAPKDWRAAFEKTYGLADGEVLKRVAPPFIPERMDYYRTEQESQAKELPGGPICYVIECDRDGKLSFRSAAFADKPRALADLIRDLSSSPMCYFDIPKELAKLPVEGDWVVAKDAEPQAILGTLGKILREQLDHGAPRRDMRFEREESKRDVIVMSGDYKFTGLEKARDPKALYICNDYPAQWFMSGRMLRDMNELKRAIEDVLEMPVINEAHGDPHGIHAELYRAFTSPNEERSLRISKCMNVLEMVTKQTALAFRIEPRTVPSWVMKEGSASAAKTSNGPPNLAQIEGPLSETDIHSDQYRAELKSPARITVPVAQEQIEAGPQVKTHSTTQPGTVADDNEEPLETRYYEFRNLGKDDFPAIEKYLTEQLPGSPKRYFAFHDKQFVLTDTIENLAQFEKYLAEIDIHRDQYTAELKVMTMKKEEAASVLRAYCDVNSQKPISFTIARQDAEELAEDLDKLSSTKLEGAPRITFKVRPLSLKHPQPKVVMRDNSLTRKNAPERALDLLVQHPETYSTSFADWFHQKSPVDGVIADCTTEFFTDASGASVPRMWGMLAGYKLTPIANSDDLDVYFYFNMTRFTREGRGLAFWKSRPLPNIDEAPLEEQLRYTPNKPIASVSIRDAEKHNSIQVVILTLTKVEEPGQMFFESH